jgi:hypothetical protein
LERYVRVNTSDVLTLAFYSNLCLAENAGAIIPQ